MALVDQAAIMTKRGVAKAHEDYRNWSGGRWLQEAPEYMATTYIAKELSLIPSIGLYVTLEEGVRRAVQDAGGTVRRRSLRPKHAKFDIVLWRGYTPRGVVEVKHQPHGFVDIENDLDRICDVLLDNNTFRFGLIGFFRSFDAGEEKPAEDRLNDRIESVSCGAQSLVECKGLRFKAYPPHVQQGVNDEDDSAWGAVVIGILRP